jgi:GNAT superfamily N-acetyltransferase
MEERFGAEALGRMSVFGEMRAVHAREMAATPHWYVFIVGVAPEVQRQGIGGSLLTPIHEEADRESIPCYLETMVIENVRFYEKPGFAVVDSGATSVGEVPFWAMRREATQSDVGTSDSAT